MKQPPNKSDTSPFFLLLMLAMICVVTQCQKPAKTAKDVDWNLVDQLIEHRR